MDFNQRWFGDRVDIEEAFAPGDIVHVSVPNDVGYPEEDATIVCYTRNNCWRIREPKHNTTVDIDGKYIAKVK